MINDSYLEGAAGLVIGQSIDIPSHMAFGSTFGTLTGADIITSGEFDRVSLSTGERSGAIAKHIGLRSSASASSDGDLIQVVGIHTSSAGGDLWTNMLLSSLLHTTDFDVEVEMWGTFERK